MPPKKRSCTLSSLFNLSQRGSRQQGFRIATDSSSPTPRSSANRASDSNTSSGNRQKRNSAGDGGLKSIQDLGVSDLLTGIRQRLVEEAQSCSAAAIERDRLRALEVAFGSSNSDSQSTPGKSQGSSSNRLLEEEELCVSSVEFSLICPYSLQTMEVPVRSRDCHHVQCCDVNSWVVLLDKARALRDPVGSCPVCKKRVAASSLAVDLWVLDVEKHLPRGTHLVILESDGTYRSADSVREKRREMVTEVVDATQSDYVNHFGEIIEEEEDDFFPSDDLNPVESVVCSIRPSASFEPVFMDERSMVEEMSQKRPRVAEEGGNTPLRKVKLELTDMPPPSPPVTASQDDGVTIVSYVESSNAVHRTLPSQLRLWELHCPHCGAVLVKGEDGSMRQCARCQEKGELLPADLILVRRFEENPSVSLELHPDGTCLLSGVDEAAPYLIRAGYHRSPFVCDSAAPSLFPLFSSKKQDLTKNKGVWSSTLSLTRFEMDFLEACCHRIARGERLEEMDYRMVPSVFRIPRRRPPNSAASSPFASQFNGSKNTLGNYNNNGVRDGYPS